ncbi:MAG: hypothetical protein LBJ16_02145 [Holosporaceae bacterium]|nr:hypothetical protein [Holosporaceae bacterium]
MHGNRLNIHGDEIDDKIYELERWIKLSMIRGKLNELKFGPGGIPGLDVDAAVKEEALIREDGTDAEMDKWLREGELDATDGMKDSFRGALNHFYHWWLELLSADTPGGRREELRSWTGLVEYLRITRNVQLSHGCLRVIQYLRANGLMPNNDPVYLSCYETTARNLREICGE